MDYCCFYQTLLNTRVSLCCIYRNNLYHISYKFCSLFNKHTLPVQKFNYIWVKGFRRQKKYQNIFKVLIPFQIFQFILNHLKILLDKMTWEKNMGAHSQIHIQKQNTILVFLSPMLFLFYVLIRLFYCVEIVNAWI